MAGLFTTRIRT